MAFNGKRELQKIPASIRPVIQLGDSGWWVRLLRKLLYQVGLGGDVLPSEPSLFDAGLSSLLRLYQKQTAITVDGIAGPQTWAAFAGESEHDLRLVESGEPRKEQLRQSVVAVARYAEQLQVREEGGNNRGAMVEWILDFAQGKPGWPWCVAFAWAVVSHAHLIEHSRAPAVPRLSCSALVKWAKKEGRLRLRIGAPAPGDLWVLQENKRYYHVGVVVEVRSDGTLVTIEGNTGPQPGAQDADGDGVYQRERPAHSGVAVDVA
jgi:hypothetical protein